MSKLHKKQTLQRTKMAIYPTNMKIHFKREEGLYIPKGVNRHKENQSLIAFGLVLFLFYKRNAESELSVSFIK